MDVKEKYNALAKTYSLPKFEEIDSDFEIHDADVNHLIRSILRKIAEKLEFYINLLADVLQPDAANLAGMHETGFFTSKEKAEMYALFKKLMKVHRTIVQCCLDGNEKVEAQFLKQFLGGWKDLKPQLLVVVEKMKESWDKDIAADEKAGYFG